MLGIPAAQTRRTGRMVERVSTVRRKRELLSADVAKVIDLLMSADDADGLMADLDGNPATPSERLDARESQRGTPGRLALIARHYLEVAAMTDEEILALDRTRA